MAMQPGMYETEPKHRIICIDHLNNLAIFAIIGRQTYSGERKSRDNHHLTLDTLHHVLILS